MTKLKEEEKTGVHVYKTSLAGDGSFYLWKEYDENGGLVRESEQMFNSEADAEKAMRAVAPSSDIVEVVNVKNINAEANLNVNLVKKSVTPENFGMNAVSRSIEDKAAEEAALEVEEGMLGSKSEKKEKKSAPELVIKVSGADLSKAVAEQEALETKPLAPAKAKSFTAPEHPNVAKTAGVPAYQKAELSGKSKKNK